MMNRGEIVIVDWLGCKEPGLVLSRAKWYGVSRVLVRFKPCGHGLTHEFMKRWFEVHEVERTYCSLGKIYKTKTWHRMNIKGNSV